MRTLCPLLAALLLLPVIGAGADPKVDALLAKGDAERARKHLPAALGQYMEAEKLAPTDATVLLRLSEIYSDKVDVSEAEADGAKSLDYAKRALAAAPKSAEAHLAVAIAYGKMTDFVGNRQKLEYAKEVKAESEQALALDGTLHYGWYMLGRWHYGVANLNGALKLLTKIVFGGMPPASNDEAVRCLTKAVKLQPQELAYHSALARALTAVGRKEEAKTEWREVLKLKPKDDEGRDDQKEARKVLGS